MNDEIKSLVFEVCNELVSMGWPSTDEIHECFMRSTGDRGKHPNPLMALARWALTDGAPPAPSSEDDAVRKSWARFSHELHRTPDAPYPGMADAFERHFSQSFTDRDWRSESGTWAAAWKAAKTHGAQPEPIIPEGWKLVPIVSTYDMDLAGSSHCDGYMSVAIEVWDAMLAAAPEIKP